MGIIRKLLRFTTPRKFLSVYLALNLLFLLGESYRLFRIHSISQRKLNKMDQTKGPRDLYKEFTVEACSPELKEQLGVKTWGTWSTSDSEKYKVGIRSPLKVYDVNELSYIISGKMTITPDEGQNKGIPISDGFSCYWFVEEEVTKHYYLW